MTLEAIEPDEIERYRGKVSGEPEPKIEQSVGGVLICYGPDRAMTIHQWGAIPDAVVMLATAKAQLSVNCMNAIANGVFNAKIQMAAEQQQVQAIRQSIGNGKPRIFNP